MSVACSQGPVRRALLGVLALTASVSVATVPAQATPGARAPLAAAPASAPGGAWVALPPAPAFQGSVGAGATQRVAVSGVPAGAAAWLTVSESGATKTGALTVYRTGTGRPVVANVAFAAAQAASNTAVVTTSATGQVDVHNSSTAAVTVRVDVDGYYQRGAPASPGMYGSIAPLPAAHAVTVTAGGAANVTVAGAGGVPSSAAIVLANIAIAAPQGAGTVIAYPRGASRPDTQSVVFTAGRPTVTLGAVRVGTSGQITLTNTSAVSVTIDVSVLGYYLQGTPVVGSAFTKTAPVRVVDTARGIGAPAGPAAADTTLTTTVEGMSGMPAAGVSAVVLMVSVSGATRSGFLTGFPPGTTRPAVPFVDFAPSRPASSLIVIPLSSAGRIALYNASAGTVEVRADLVGYYLTPSRLAWAAPQRPGAVASAQLSSVSCVGTTFCMAVDVEGNTLRYNGIAWTRTLSQLSYQTSSRVSCATATFCIDVDSNGNAWQYDGARWSTAGSLSLFGDVHLACPTTTFCLAGARAGVSAQWSTFNGAAWSDPADLPADGFDDLSCASASFCLASFIESGTGASLVTSSARFNGSAWSGLTPIAGLRAQNVAGGAMLSCPATTFCMILSIVGAKTLWNTYNGTAWGSAHPAPAELGPLGLSCRSVTFCAAVVNVPGSSNLIGEAVMTFTGSRWSALTPVQPGGSFTPAIGCGSPARCVVVADGLASVWTGSTWLAAATVDPDSGSPLRQVRCVSSTFCVATNQAHAMVFDGAHWSAPKRVGVISANPDAYQSSVSAVSCTSASFCLAVTPGSAGGDINDTTGWAVYNGTSWSIHPPTMTGFLSSVSCVSPTWCVAVGLHVNTSTFEPISDAWLFNGTSWSHQANLGKGTVVQAVQCLSKAWCIALAPTIASSSTRPGWSLFTGSTWSAFATFGSAADAGVAAAVSCQSVTFCVAVDGAGDAATFNGTAWSASRQVASAPLTDISCTQPATCTAVGSAGFVQYAGQQQWLAPVATGLHGSLTSVSCPSQTLCIAVDDHGSAAVGRAR